MMRIYDDNGERERGSAGLLVVCVGNKRKKEFKTK
jgi:hypothetical protein